MSSDIEIRSIGSIRSESSVGSEVSWFAPLCNGDYRYLGFPENHLKSTFEHTKQILLNAEKNGFRNILCPSSYQVGQDTLSFVSAMAAITSKINLLAAIRCGEVHPPMLARAISTIDNMAKGRLTINIISSDLPGEKLPSEARYQRSREVIEVLKQAWTRDRIEFEGEFYKYSLDSAPVKPYQVNGGPLLYFGGYSPAAKKLCAEHCDVYLMWPETKDVIKSQMQEMSELSREFDRKIDYGLRVHVIVRETEDEAKQYAKSLISKLDLEKGQEIKHRAQDSKSLGVSKQVDLRSRADKEGFVDRHLYTGIGLARSGCGAAIVGDPDQVLNELQAYEKLGIKAFILSGYPQIEECDLFAKYVLPRMNTISLPEAQGRVPATTPETPLGCLDRV